jgi:hypothetical protein
MCPLPENLQPSVFQVDASLLKQGETASIYCLLFFLHSMDIECIFAQNASYRVTFLNSLAMGGLHDGTTTKHGKNLLSRERAGAATDDRGVEGERTEPGHVLQRTAD